MSERERRGEEGRAEGVCLVISSRSLPSGAVVRWLAGRPEGLRACAGPPTRRRSGPGCHLGCSGRSSWRLPGRHPRRSHLWTRESVNTSVRREANGSERKKQRTLSCSLTFLHWLRETTDLRDIKQTRWCQKKKTLFQTHIAQIPRPRLPSSFN